MPQPTTVPEDDQNKPTRTLQRRITQLKRDITTRIDVNGGQEALHKLQMSRMMNTTTRLSSVAPYDSFGIDLTSLAITEQTIFAGDKAGMLYFGSRTVPNAPWSVHHHLGSQITSVHAHQGTTYAASLGPKPQILISTNDYTASFGMHAFHDVWTVQWITSDLPDVPDDTTTTSVGSAVLGMKQRAAYMPSLETHRGCYIMPTNADVFAVHKHHSQILTGARNGSVKLFDIRAPPQTHCTIFHPCVRTGRFPNGGWDSLVVPVSQQQRRNTTSPSKSAVNRQSNVLPSTGHASAVTNLQVVNEWGLLLAAMDGILAVYDLRFCGYKSESRSLTPSRVGSLDSSSPRPVITFSGHVNSHSQNLGFCVDPAFNFIFAAGEDNRVRAWSLRTGDAILHSTGHDSPLSDGQASSRNQKLLALKKFTRPVNALVLASEDLWVASGRDVFCFENALGAM